MVKIISDGRRELAVTGGTAHETETQALLTQELPDAYRVYQAVHWTNVGSGKGFSIYGEINFVAVNKAGDLLLIVQKSGPIKETFQGLVKRYDDKVKRSPPRWPEMWPSSSASCTSDRVAPRAGSRTCSTAPITRSSASPAISVRDRHAKGIIISPPSLLTSSRISRERFSGWVRLTPAIQTARAM